MLAAAGWAVQDAARGEPRRASRGVAVREFVMKPPHGRADYLLFVDGQAVGVVEAKTEGETLTGVEWQTREVRRRPARRAADRRSRARCRSSTSRPASRRGSRTGSTRTPASRQVFSFHRPETLAGWLERDPRAIRRAPTLRHRLRALPPLRGDGPVAGAGRARSEPRGVARGEPAAGADPDGDRLGQDVHGGERRLPAGQARRRPARSCSSSTARTSAARR